MAHRLDVLFVLVFCTTVIVIAGAVTRLLDAISPKILDKFLGV